MSSEQPSGNQAGKLLAVGPNAQWFSKKASEDSNNNDKNSNEKQKSTLSVVGQWKHRTLVSCASAETHSLFVDASGRVFACGHDIKDPLLGINPDTTENNNNNNNNNKTNNDNSNSPLTSAQQSKATQGAREVVCEAWLQVPVVAVACSATTSLALTESGVCFQWGWSGQGLLPTPTKLRHTSPLPLFKAIACGYRFAIALDVNGKVWIWGDDSDFAIAKDVTTPRTIDLFSNLPVKAVACGKHQLLVLTDSGKLFSIGGTATAAQEVPLESGVQIKSIASGASHYVLCTEDGRVFTWGENINKCLGYDASGTQTVPKHVASLSGVSRISTFGSQNIALCGNGVICVWGGGESSEPSVLDAVGKYQPSVVSCGAGHVMVYAGPTLDVPFEPAMTSEDERNCKTLLVSKVTQEVAKSELQAQYHLLQRYQSQLNFVLAISRLRLASHQASLGHGSGDHPLEGTKEEYELVILGLRFGLASAKPNSTKKSRSFIETHNVSHGLKDAGFSFDELNPISTSATATTE